MHESKGRIIPLSGPRRFINDLVYFARRVPSVPLSRTLNVARLAGPRRAHPSRPSWAALFMKAYALVAVEHPPLRRMMLDLALAAALRAPDHALLAGRRADHRR